MLRKSGFGFDSKGFKGLCMLSLDVLDPHPQLVSLLICGTSQRLAAFRNSSKPVVLLFSLRKALGQGGGSRPLFRK